MKKRIEIVIPIEVANEEEEGNIINRARIAANALAQELTGKDAADVYVVRARRTRAEMEAAKVGA